MDKKCRFNDCNSLLLHDINLTGIGMQKRKAVVTSFLLLFITSSILTFYSASVEQWDLFDEFIGAYAERPVGIFYATVTWFGILWALQKMGFRVTAWWAVICFFIAFIVGYAFIYQGVGEENAPLEETRIAVMTYIKENHPTTVRLLENITWSGNDVTPSGLVGKTIYQYLGGGWNVTISWAVVKDPNYEANAEYSSSNNDLIIIWEGTVDKAGVVEEEIKGSYQSIESVRDTVLGYLIENLPDMSVNISNQVWTLDSQEPMIGWVEYTYLSNEWNVTISYAVYLDVTYYVTVENLSENIIWSGTIYDGIVNQQETDNIQ